MKLEKKIQIQTKKTKKKAIEMNSILQGSV